MAKEPGQEVTPFDPWGEDSRRYVSQAGERTETSKFNPLSILDPSQPGFADEAAQLADTVIVANF